jgi:hypothetical protein
VLAAVGDWDPELAVSHDWDYVLRAAEVAEVRADPAVATYYRDHAGGVTSDIRTGLADARGVVERYFDRHPEDRRTRLERRAGAMLDALSARVLATHGRPGQAVLPLARAMLTDPRAAGGELRRGLPALGGHLRRRLRRGRPVRLP